MNENYTVQFKLISISIEEFATFEENFDPAHANIDIGFKSEIMANPDTKRIGLFTNYKLNQTNQNILILKIGCHFELAENYWTENINNNQLVLNKSVLTHFLVLTVGTSRGILHVKKPTWLGNFILPTLDITKIFPDDLVIDLKSEK